MWPWECEGILSRLFDTAGYRWHSELIEKIKMNTEITNLTVSAEVKVIPNFAFQHLKAATIFRNHVLRLELENEGRPLDDFFEEIRSYSSACIMSSVASLEALINELFIDPTLPLRPLLKNFETEFWDGIERKSILEKYQKALTLIGVASLNENSFVYKGAWGMIELRNALIHYKPIWDPLRKRTVELIEELDGKFSHSPFTDHGADFVAVKCMSGGCVSWCVSTALSFMKEFANHSKIAPDKMQNFWRLETI